MNECLCPFLLIAIASLPLLAWTCLIKQLLVASVAHVAVIQSSKPGKGKPSGRSTVGSPVGSVRTSAILGKITTRIKNVIGNETGVSLTPLRSPISLSRASGSTAAGAANNKIVPVISEDRVVAFEQSTAQTLTVHGPLP